MERDAAIAINEIILHWPYFGKELTKDRKLGYCIARQLGNIHLHYSCKCTFLGNLPYASLRDIKAQSTKQLECPAKSLTPNNSATSCQALCVKCVVATVKFIGSDY